MISSVTPAVISGVMSSAALHGLAQFLSLVAAATFLVLLIEKEMVDGDFGPRSRSLSRGLNIAIVPLGMAFVLIVAFALLQLG